MSNECQMPTDGWKCSRGAGHEGPCAASPTETWFRLKLVAVPARDGIVRRENVRVMCAQTGALLSGVSRVEVVCDAQKNTQDLVLTILDAEMEVEGMVSAVKVLKDMFPQKRKSFWTRLREWWAK